MYYFGTNLTTVGHYFWELERDKMHSSRLRVDSLPFNPEQLPYGKSGNLSVPIGTVEFHRFAGISILAIQGSCQDKRPGSKSVFFTKQEVNKDEMKQLILSTPIAAKIVNQMPFKINW